MNCYTNRVSVLLLIKRLLICHARPNPAVKVAWRDKAAQRPDL